MRSHHARSVFTAVLGLAILSCTDSPTQPRSVFSPSNGASRNVTATAGPIVISQVYGGGGNSGATIKNDFIELFNPGTSDVVVTGWSVQYNSATSTTQAWQATNLTGTIPAGGYYLVQESQGAGGTTSLTPDASGPIQMSATAGRVVLRQSTTLLTTAQTCPTDVADVIDVVGFGSTLCSAPFNTAGLSNTTAAVRGGNGCTYTGSPSADFTALAPNPRNSASTHVTCGGSGPTVTSVTITLNGSTAMLSGSSSPVTAHAFNGTQDVTAQASITWASTNNTVANFATTTGASNTVSALTAGTATISASVGAIHSNTIDLTVTAAQDRSNTVVISQIYGGGGNTGAPYKNDFIELFNTTSAPIDVTGWSVQYSSSGNASWSTTPLTGVIPPRTYYLVQEAAGNSTTAADLPTPDIIAGTGTTLSMSGTNGKVVLSQTTTPMNTACPSGVLVVDFVPYGSGSTCANATPNVSNSTSAMRLNGGCLNTQNPAADFTIVPVSPRNSTSSRQTCAVGAFDHVTVSGNGSVLAGSTTQLSAKAFDVNGDVIAPTTFTWTTNDASIATVNATGLVTGVTAGGTPATISAAATVAGVSKTGTLDVAVNNPGGINWLDVSYSADSMPAGFQAQIFLTAREQSGGTIIPATFVVTTIDDPVIATGIATGSGPVVQGVAAPTVPGTRPRLKITATPVGGGTPYVFTTGTSTSIPIEVGTAASPSIYAKNDEFGDPTPASAGNPNDFLIQRSQYVLSYNTSHGTPNWVSYELDHRQRPGSVDRCNCFTAEPLLPANKQIFTTDYTGGGYDRGHMTRSADRTAAQIDNAETFILSNVVPQTAELNEATWAHFENILGDSADAGRAVYIITGPLYSRTHGLAFLRDSGKVAIPDSTWKVALVGPMNGVPFTLSSIQTWDDLAGVSVVAVNMPNTHTIANLTQPDLNDWKNYVTTVHSIEAATGFNFLSALPANFQFALEAGDHAPVPSFAMTGVANEGSPLTFDASATTDPDLGRTDMERTEALSYSWHFSDGSVASGKVVTKTFADNGPFTASLTVTDAYGWERTTMQTVTVANVAPSATFIMPSPAPVLEGAMFTLSMTGATDASMVDAAALTFAFDCGTGTYGAATSSASVNCVVQDNGASTVRAKVIDKDGAFTEYTGSFTTTNVAPTATFAVPNAPAEGSPFTIALNNAADPSPVDAAHLSFAFDCGKGYGTASANASASCIVDDNGDAIVHGKVMDKDGGVTEYAATVHVVNAPPTAVFTAPATVNEGAAIALSVGNVTDPSTADAEAGFTFAFDCGTGFGAASSNASTTCSTTDNGPRTVRAQVTDKDGGSTIYTATVQVLNVAPTVTFTTLTGATTLTVQSGDPVAATGTFTDPGPDSPWHASVNWGDGTSNQPIPSSFTVSGAKMLAGTTYMTAGSYASVLSVTDKDGGIGTATINVTVTRRNIRGEAIPDKIKLDDRGNDNVDIVLYSDVIAHMSDIDAASVRIGTVGLATNGDGSLHYNVEGNSGKVKLTFDRQALIGAGLITSTTTTLDVMANLGSGLQLVSHVPVSTK
ncbi:MAG TPA: DNA/RNA non-specific endonuclease [Gemmatimonadaceae bacterium]|nr:DNA/RNA non-specific endonuclease [Gemmatimonadaceae bacterium]